METQLEKQNPSLFVVILRYGVSLDKIDAHRAAHLAFLEPLYAQGVFLASGPQVPRTGGVILAACESKDALSVILSRDPFSQHGLATYDIIEFIPTKYQKGFEALFATTG